MENYSNLNAMMEMLSPKMDAIVVVMFKVILVACMEIKLHRVSAPIPVN